MLESAIALDPKHAPAHEMLGNWLYDRGRHDEALTHWQTAVDIDPARDVAWRNLGIASFNVQRDSEAAQKAYAHACQANPSSPRLLIEQNQLDKLIGVAPEKRLEWFAQHTEMTRTRDDLTVEWAELRNNLGEYQDALDALESRCFQPWEGGEGRVLAQFKRAHLGLAQQAMGAGEPELANEHLHTILNPPQSLGEAWHLLVNLSDVWFMLGEAAAQLNQSDAATAWWQRAAEFKGDFVEMSVRSYSTLSLWSALARQRIGDETGAQQQLTELLNHAQELEQTPAKIDYFATSLPTMLLFHDDLDRRQKVTARTMQAQALAGLGRWEHAEQTINEAMSLDRYDNAAADTRAWIQSQTESIR